jgi:hypothetical protein
MKRKRGLFEMRNIGRYVSLLSKEFKNPKEEFIIIFKFNYWNAPQLWPLSTLFCDVLYGILVVIAVTKESLLTK